MPVIRSPLTEELDGTCANGVAPAWSRAPISATIDAMKAIVHTSMGDIALDLFPDHAPNTVNNFVGLARGERE